MNIRYSGRLANPPPFEHDAGMKWGMRISCLLGVNQSGNMQKGIDKKGKGKGKRQQQKQRYKFTTANHSSFALFSPSRVLLVTSTGVARYRAVHIIYNRPGRMGG